MGFVSRDGSRRGSAPAPGLVGMQEMYGIGLGQVDEQDEEVTHEHSHEEIGGGLEMNEQDMIGYDLSGTGKDDDMQARREEKEPEQVPGWNESKTKVWLGQWKRLRHRVSLSGDIWIEVN